MEFVCYFFFLELFLFLHNTGHVESLKVFEIFLSHTGIIWLGKYLQVVNSTGIQSTRHVYGRAGGTDDVQYYGTYVETTVQICHCLFQKIELEEGRGFNYKVTLKQETERPR